MLGNSSARWHGRRYQQPDAVLIVGYFGLSIRATGAYIMALKAYKMGIWIFSGTEGARNRVVFVWESFNNLYKSIELQ